ncbi:MAG: CaiB/BaiF CoA-transferase family protein [Acidobacteriia bacterium]|nr:CaiB/BaiF CoA-transferase family protein [Terriglobia bacterium]
MLDEITVLDLSRYLPGPYATRVLADLGAKVIKIEDPRGGDPIRGAPPFVKDQSALHLELNRNKKGLTLNFTQGPAREIFYKLVGSSDVVVESFRPGVTSRLGIDYESVKAHNPGIIYCSISGYGQDGPFCQRAGHDINYIARSGVLGLNVDAAGTPVLPPIQVADLASGAMLALTGILAALYDREKTGKGHHIDISMLDGALALLPVAFAYTKSGQSKGVGEETDLSGELPFYNVYQTADKKFLSVGAIELKFWQNFCRAIERPDLISKQLLEGKERKWLFKELQNTLQQRTQAEWMRRFDGLDVCCEPVQSIDEVLSDPQVQYRKMIRHTTHPVLGKLMELASPLKLSGFESPQSQPAPRLGEHNQEILRALGYSDREIQEFKASEVL